jgi:uncharacterized membrane protein YdbT with pleckstrin-like domain
MPVIPCPDCNRDVSTLAPACPHCGRPSPAAATPLMSSAAPPTPAREETVWHGSPSWTLLIGRIAGLVVCAIAIPLCAYLVAPASDDPQARADLVAIGWIITSVAVFVFAIAIVAGMLKLRSTKYTLTNQRLLIETGLVSKRLDEIDMRLIDDSRFDQSVVHRLLGIGNVTVISSDKNTPVYVLHGVADPRAVREMIRSHSYQASQRQVFMRPT